MSVFWSVKWHRRKWNEWLPKVTPQTLNTRVLLNDGLVTPPRFHRRWQGTQTPWGGKTTKEKDKAVSLIPQRLAFQITANRDPRASATQRPEQISSCTIKDCKANTKNWEATQRHIHPLPWVKPAVQAMGRAATEHLRGTKANMLPIIYN